MYQYNIREVLKVVDGDTIRATVDLGCDVHINMTIRLAHIDAPEISTPEGIAARDHLASLLLLPLSLRTIKDKREKYGRYLGELASGRCSDLNQRMVDDGHAVRYEGGHR